MSTELVQINDREVPIVIYRGRRVITLAQMDQVQPSGGAVPHFVYLIESRKTGRFKIGVSKDPEKRLHDLEIQKEEHLNLLKCWDCAAFVIRTHDGEIKHKGPHPIEKALHKKFNNSRAHMEWFCLSEQIVKDLISIPTVVELASFVGITEFNLERAPTEQENRAKTEAIFNYFQAPIP